SLDDVAIAQAQESAVALVPLGGRQERARARAALGIGSDLIQTQAAQVGAAPLLILACGHRDLLIGLPRLQPALAYPLGLIPAREKLGHGLVGKAAPRDRSSHATFVLSSSQHGRSSL